MSNTQAAAAGKEEEEEGVQKCVGASSPHSKDKGEETPDLQFKCNPVEVKMEN